MNPARYPLSWLLPWLLTKRFETLRDCLTCCAEYDALSPLIWIAPSERDAADQFRANSGLKSQEYSAPVLGLIFLRFAEVRFAAKRAQLESPSPLGGETAGVRGEASTPRVSRRGSRVDEPAAYHAEGILYLPAEARFDFLLNRPEAENIGAKVNAAMRDVTKCELRITNCEVQPVRHSTFGTRTSAARPLSIRHSTLDTRHSSFAFPRFLPRWTTTPSGASTNTSSASSP
jgi:hypothetical protein